jgi:multidrug resistance efflux pump
MPAKRTYNIKGTNDFLIFGAIFFFLCLWAVKDAWFPSDKVLKKHPIESIAAFDEAGSVDKIYVQVDDAIVEGQILAELRIDKVAVEYDAAKDAYTEAKDKHGLMVTALKNANKNGASDQGIRDLQERVDISKTAMDEALASVSELRMVMDSSELKAPSKGVIKEIKAATHTMVDAGETVIVIDPKDHFYLFNKSLSIFSFIAFWVFLAIHILGR